jgi:hypothetical protein
VVSVTFNPRATCAHWLEDVYPKLEESDGLKECSLAPDEDIYGCTCSKVLLESPVRTAYRKRRYVALEIHTSK